MNNGVHVFWFLTKHDKVGWVRYEVAGKKWDAYLCITPPALREAEYLQSALGTLGCKRE